MENDRKCELLRRSQELRSGCDSSRTYANPGGESARVPTSVSGFSTNSMVIARQPTSYGSFDRAHDFFGRSDGRKLATELLDRGLVVRERREERLVTKTQRNEHQSSRHDCGCGCGDECCGKRSTKERGECRSEANGQDTNNGSDYGTGHESRQTTLELQTSCRTNATMVPSGVSAIRGNATISMTALKGPPVRTAARLGAAARRA